MHGTHRATASSIFPLVRVKGSPRTGTTPSNVRFGPCTLRIPRFQFPRRVLLRLESQYDDRLVKSYEDRVSHSQYGDNCRAHPRSLGRLSATI